jgi:hypothetical protein
MLCRQILVNENFITNTSIFKKYQTGGFKDIHKKGNYIEKVKYFMLLLLKITTDTENIKTSLNTCFNNLIPFISNDFKYNNNNGKEGLNLLCRHIKNINTAFPTMNMTITQFKDIQKNSVIVIIMILGVMKGPWLNTPASNKYERLGIVIHILTNKENKINEINFKSEHISEECYKKIRALDILHTAFSISHKTSDSKNKEIKKIEAIPVISIQTNKEIKNKINKSYNKKEVNDFQIIENKTNNLYNKKEVNNFQIIENKTNNLYNKKEVNNFQIIENELIQKLQEMDDKELDDKVYLDDKELDDKELDDKELDDKELDDKELDDKELDDQYDNYDFKNTTYLNKILKGGNRYYNTIKQIPIAKTSDIKGYSSYCKPLFKTDGYEYDSLTKSSENKKEEIISKTVSMMKNGVIYSITKTIVDNIGKNTADVMGLTGYNKNKIINHMRQHMHNDAHKIVKKLINDGVITFSKVIPSNERHITYIPLNKEQKGGSFVGTLGTLLFPSDNLITNIVPWFLTLGTILSKRIEKDIYSISSTLGLSKLKNIDLPIKKESVKIKKGSVKIKKGSVKIKKGSVKKGSMKKGSVKIKKGNVKIKKGSVKKGSMKKGSVTINKGNVKIKKGGVKKENIKIKKGSVKTIKSKKKWEPLTNSDIRKLMQGGSCNNGLCDDISL